MAIMYEELRSLHTCIGHGKEIDDFGGTDCQDLDIRIGGKECGLDTIENNLRVSRLRPQRLHKRERYSYTYSLYKMADSLSRPLWIPFGTASHPEYTVTR